MESPHKIFELLSKAHDANSKVNRLVYCHLRALYNKSLMSGEAKTGYYAKTQNKLVLSSLVGTGSNHPYAEFKPW